MLSSHGEAALAERALSLIEVLEGTGRDLRWSRTGREREGSSDARALATGGTDELHSPGGAHPRFAPHLFQL
jgi:hypothetical protein